MAVYLPDPEREQGERERHQQEPPQGLLGHPLDGTAGAGLGGRVAQRQLERQQPQHPVHHALAHQTEPAQRVLGLPSLG